MLQSRLLCYALGMFSMCKLARELLPLVVVAWATFAILGGVLKAAEHTESGSSAGTDDTGSITAKALGLCAVTVAVVVLKAGARIVWHPPGLLVNLVWRFRTESRAVSRLMAYERPPPATPPLEFFQILRT